MLRFLTWFWRQEPDRQGYDADKVNRCLLGLSARLTIPHELAVVTDHPSGIDSSIQVIPLPKKFEGLRVRRWSERSGMPQCYRRLELYRPDAAEIFGADDLVSLDMDVLFFGERGNLDPLFAEPCDFRIFAGTQRQNPYNGSLTRIRAGARARVYEQFAADPQGIAERARANHIGSDQAVIAELLGPGERTWDESDGVYFYSSKLLRRARALHRDCKPDGIRMLFFPGNCKPWSENIGADWIRGAWSGRRSTRFLRLRAYRDPKGWGQKFAAAAKAQGLFCSLFTKARMVPTGIAFVRLDQAGREREISKRVVADLNRIGVRTLPTAREAIWYDDKGAQLAPLGKWMPHTAMIRDRQAAEAYATEQAVFPLVSKAIDGSASKTVRVLHTVEQALEEVRRAWSPGGIPSVYQRRQAGYVYWQELVPGNARDYRVCVVGAYVYGLVRENKPGTITASGSGIFRPLELGDPLELAAAQLAVEIADELNTQWMAFDVIFDPTTGRPLVLEMSSAWTMDAYAAAPCFTRDGLERTALTGANSFEIAVGILEAMWNQ